VKATRKIALKKAWSEDKLKVRIRVTWEVLGEKSWSVEDSLYTQANVKFPAAFSPAGPNEWVGELSKDEVLVSWISNSYDDLWTVKPVIQISKED
jgi:HJR/Mrr/RecB family endonuclease